jgi:uncharacterized protein (TIGR00251 family)
VTAAAVLTVRLTPRSSRDAIEGVDDGGELRVRVTAAPADGAANAALTRLLAKALRVPKTSVSIVAGASSRHKKLLVEGVAAAELRQRWPGLRAYGR